MGGLPSSLGGCLAGLGGGERQWNRVLGEPPAGAPEGPGRAGCWPSSQAAGRREGAASWCSPAVSPAAASARAPQPPERSCPLPSLPVDRFTFPALEEDVIYDDVPCENLDAHQPGTPPPRFPAAFRGSRGAGGRGPGRVCSISLPRPTRPCPSLRLSPTTAGVPGAAGAGWGRGQAGPGLGGVPQARGGPGQSFHLTKPPFPAWGEPRGSPGFPGLLGKRTAC